ncbi:MAG TPA: hypothetical protein VFA50_19990 [Stellaceae bacterium]|nr:hypothetical protein [Stellaceae bacterium]
MKTALIAAISIVFLASPAISGSNSSTTSRPHTNFGATTGSRNAAADYQTWLHRHDGLLQFNHPAPTPSPSPSAQQRDYQLWLHRHDGLLQFNNPPGWPH